MFGVTIQYNTSLSHEGNLFSLHVGVDKFSFGATKVIIHSFILAFI